nr:M20 family metallopeptidase [Maliibacterium massiliense]
MMYDPKELAKTVQDYCVALRRDFHRHPELGRQEVRTQRRILEELTALGIDCRPCGGTGALAEIKGGEGPVLVLRADIDALAVCEETGLPFASEEPGKMHACGHDMHTAMLLGAAKALVGVQDQLKGTVRLVFQPAEETVTGAPLVIDDGALVGASAAFGMHVDASQRVGCVSISPGPAMAEADRFALTVQGRGGHGGLPHNTADPIVAAAAVVTALQSIVSRRTSPLDALVVSVCSINGGSGFNIIPNAVHMSGTVRYFDEALHDQVPQAMRDVAQNVAQGYGCSAQLEYTYCTPPTVNEPEMTRRFAASAAKIVGEQNVLPCPMTTGAEDFAYFGRVCPSAYAQLGASADLSCQYPNHHAKFSVDERALEVGVAVWLQLCQDFLG